MRTNYYCLFLFIQFLFLSTATTYSQTENFDETWREFLENNKISNMSELIRPDKNYKKLDYAKYLLMNVNTSFCQSKVANAEELMTELQEMDPRLHQAIPKFVGKMNDLDDKIKAYHSIDAIWKEFLVTKEVDLQELEGITAAKSLCEKATLAKYSYMIAYYHMCEGEVDRARDIFENRTLRLTEKTSLRVNDVEGLAPEVAKMKTMLQDMSKLDVSWKRYIQTGVSPGFDIELPLFPCYPIPNMKEFVLKGVVDVCSAGPEMLERIKKLQNDTGVFPEGELEEKIKELEAAIGNKESNLATLNEAWEAFIPDNKVRHLGKYGYDYCSTEPLIKAYLMDGFAFVCDLGEEMLFKIDSLRQFDPRPLEQTTRMKINELAALGEEYEDNGRRMEKVWQRFVANGDKLLEDYYSAEFYCDNIHRVEDWTIRGLTSSCEVSNQYLEQIEAFQETFEFYFFDDLECRVQRLRIKVWECRYDGLEKLARLEAPDNHEERLKELMEEYRMGERPDLCSSEQ